jgi:hypothetical protein
MRTRSARVLFVLVSAMMLVQCNAVPDGASSQVPIGVPPEASGEVQVLARGGYFTSTAVAQRALRASVLLPAHVAEPFRIRALDRDVAIAVRPLDVVNVEGRLEAGMVHYAEAFGAGSDFLQRVTRDGTEDYLKLAAPTRDRLTYSVALAPGVAGLRLVEDSLEFVDDIGAPRLRIARPYGVDARGERFPVKLSVEGCAVDTDARAPWGRAITPAGAKECVVHASWSNTGLVFPVLVDPAWAATASMAANNVSYEMLMTKLTGGQVLVANGLSTQLFDPASNTWATVASPSSGSNHRNRLIATDGDTALIVGGYAGTAIARYSLATGIWTDGTPPPGLDAGAAAAVNMGGNNVLIVLGSGATYVYDRANDVYTKRTAAPVAGVANVALIDLGGGNVAYTGYVTNSIQVYTIANDTWSQSAAVFAGDANCGSLEPLSDGTLLSYTQNGFATLLDLAGGTATPIVAPAGLATSYLCARTANVAYGSKQHYLAGGRFSYDETTKAISDNGAFPSGAEFHGAIVRLNDGRYLAAGGNAASSNSSVDVYGPSSAADCTGVTPTFFPANGTCGACKADNGGGGTLACPSSALPACQTGPGLLGQCTVCSASNESLCTFTTPRCDAATGVCAKCDGGLGSGTGRACKVGAAPACLASGACAVANGDFGSKATQPCPTAANPFVKSDGTCGKCASNAECTFAEHAGPICNVATGACGATCVIDSDCATTSYCDAMSKACGTKKADGAACTRKEECTKNVCAAGRCGDPLTGVDAGAGTDAGAGVQDSGAKPNTDAGQGVKDSGSVTPSGDAGAESPNRGGSAVSDAGDSGGAGCACRTTGRPSSEMGTVALGLASVLIARRRRRS